MNSSNVLTETLNLLCSRGAITIGEVVRRIGVPRSTAVWIIHALLAEGMIVKANTCDACSGCPLRNFCGSLRSCPTEVYVLTTKGLRVCSQRKSNAKLKG